MRYNLRYGIGLVDAESLALQSGRRWGGEPVVQSAAAVADGGRTYERVANGLAATTTYRSGGADGGP